METSKLALVVHQGQIVSIERSKGPSDPIHSGKYCTFLAHKKFTIFGAKIKKNQLFWAQI